MTDDPDSNVAPAAFAQPRLKIRPLLFEADPYEDFDGSEIPFDLQGWGSKSVVFEQFISQTRPSLILEVGSWKGGSASSMAQVCETLALPTEIVCIDTWLGAPEFWDDHGDADRYLSLKLRNGYPQVFYQFLANMMKSGQSARVTPMPLSSTAAATFLSRHNVKADLIYIDASHETNDVLVDLAAYFDLLSIGGIIFGDDADGYWPSVERAVSLFAARHDLPFEVRDSRYWVIRKNRDVKALDIEDLYRSQVVGNAPCMSGERGLLQTASRIEIANAYYPGVSFAAATVERDALMTHPHPRANSEVPSAKVLLRDIFFTPGTFLRGRIDASMPERAVPVTATIGVIRQSGSREEYCFTLDPGCTFLEFSLPLNLGSGAIERADLEFGTAPPGEGGGAYCAVYWRNLTLSAL